MVKVKLFGMMRLESGIKELYLEANVVEELYPKILEEIKKVKPYTKITIEDINGCTVNVNNKFADRYTKLNDNDVVMLLSPVCGG